MQGAFWRSQALDELMPLWYAHGRDPVSGVFYTCLGRDWQPQPPYDLYPAMISRHVFSFSAAFLMSGDTRYLEVATAAVRYLLEHAWDEEYGGWFDQLTPAGEPLQDTKTVAYQLYTDVGLTLYWMTTGDPEVLSHLRRSLQIRRTRGLDSRYGGYYQALNRDLSVRDTGKNKHAHYGYVGSLLLNLYLGTHDAQVLAYARELTDLTLDRMVDPEYGWVYGFSSTFDRRWQRTPSLLKGTETVSSGAQLTAALSWVRLYHQTGSRLYLRRAKALGDRVGRAAWDPATGAWLDPIRVGPPHGPVDGAAVSWWIQIYGAFLQLQMHHVTGDSTYLERFERSERFFLDHMIDREHGGVFSGVSAAGELVGDGAKAAPWRTSYHEIEHDLLNYLYLNLYVNQQPAVLHFALRGGEAGARHYVSLVDDPAVKIASVTLDGQPWTRFSADERSVTVPPGGPFAVQVTLAPAPTPAIRP